MQTASYVALSAEIALKSQLNTVSNNLANMNTTGFKSQQTLFKEQLSKNKTQERPLKEPTSYVEDMGQYQDFAPGGLIRTGNSLDVALRTPNTFFSIDTPQGKMYSRKGSFTIDSTHKLVTNQGLSVLSTDGEPITFAPNDSDISIAKDGTISTANGIKGRLGMFSFKEPQKLRRMGNSFFKPAKNQTADTDEKGQVEQGYLEGSNVSSILETTKMIQISKDFTRVSSYVQKHYEQQTKMLNSLMFGR